MKRLLAATATLSLLAAAGPALAAPAAKHGACKAPAGATLIKPGAKAAESAPATPIGAANEASEEAGTFVLDLGGTPETTVGKLTFTLSWDNPVSDYDLVVAGTNELLTDNPETVTFKARHCKSVPVEVSVFYGAPIDSLALAVKGS